MAVVPALLRICPSLLVVLLLSSGCKQDVEDLPDVDPVEDPWVDQIDSGNDAAVAAAPDPGAEVAGDPAALAAVPSAPSDPTLDPSAAAGSELAAAEPSVAPIDPATAEAAKLGGASVPSSSKPSSTSTTPSNPTTPTPEGAAALPDAQPSVEPTPTPTPAPAAAEQAQPAKPAEKPAPAPITMADFDGSYRFSGGESQRQELAAAIEFGANQVAAMIRGIARKRLTKTQIIEDPMTITVQGDQATFAWGTTGDGMVVTIDGPTTTMKYQGDKYKVRARSKDGKLITIFQAPDATKTIVYTLSSDRRTLTAHHKLVADQLNEPVTFKVSYTRK